MRLESSPLRLSLQILLLALCTALVAWLAAVQGERSALRADHAQALEQLQLYAGSLRTRIERYRTLPDVLALDPQLQAALSQPLTPDSQQALDRKLEQVNGAVTSSTLTLLDARGVAVAASNWRSPQSNVDHDYGFRPYFLQTREQGSGRFYAVGVTTGRPGYFLSQAVRGADGAFLGAVVIKLELGDLERQWAGSEDIVLLADAHGIVFLANRDDWHYRELRPLTAAERAELERTQQYAGEPLRPLVQRLERDYDGAGRRVRVDAAGSSRSWLWRTLGLEAEGWTLHLLRDARMLTTARRDAALTAAGGWLALVFLLLFLHGRRRLERLRQRSRKELEQLVQQHTTALRSAQDGLVQAANLAALGQGDSLEHLPQGVSVVDADLRLVAWNRRYLELFKYPPGLIVAGRPIEEVIRHNARRGLLGGGDPEEAIRRRLDYLRGGQPYVHERERPDGSVLEVRGNPLPGGGFVTSYADITAYKQAARELRSLAETLERRVQQRTEDLQVAKGEAERANRSKSRFVAAAVHDLLQPLNAARMFVSALRSRVSDAESLQLVDSVEGALGAQDQILGSLLDISRLEAGTLETRIEDFPLRPLLEALAREFGILAAARGLELRARPGSAVVRSDRALLRRILQNFLSNALRYTPRGRLLLGCRRLPGAVRIEVWDSGPGIPESKREEIFEEFRRLDTGLHQRDRGAGLGLAIVDRVARLLTHPIALRSWPGRGSVFSVTVPLGDAARSAPAAAVPAADDGSLLAGRRVWCIDDEPQVREATRVLLERWGCRVTLAGSADEALQRAQHGDAPELVLLDYRLGAQLGPELMPRLAGCWGCQPPVIVISADPEPGLRERMLEAGYAFLAKPVKPPALRALMTQLLTRILG